MCDNDRCPHKRIGSTQKAREEYQKEVEFSTDKEEWEAIVRSASGTNRSSEEGKLRYDLCFPPSDAMECSILSRWALHMTKNVESKGEANWHNASTAEDIKRFYRSAWRHWMAFIAGEDDEDHLAAILFNLQGIAYVQHRIKVDCTDWPVI